MNVANAILTILELLLTAALLFGILNDEKLIRWERTRLFPFIRKRLRKLRLNLCSRLRQNKRFMAWLEKPSISEQIYNSCPDIQVVILNDWRNQN